MQIECTPRFLNSLSRYNGIDEIVFRKIAELIRKYESDPQKWHFEMEKLKDKSLEPLNVAKIAITHGDRLIFAIEKNGFVLTDIGKHEVMQEYANLPRTKRMSDYEYRGQLPDWLRVGIDNQYTKKIATRAQSQIEVTSLMEVLDSTQNHEERWHFEEELNESWVTFLDEEQFQVTSKIINDLEIKNDSTKVHIVIGGPGTGKTIILMNIYQKLLRSNRPVTFEISLAVKKYLESSGFAIRFANKGVTPGVVGLIDDPSSPRELATLIRKARSSKARGLVIALDPLQWHERNLQAKFDDLINDFNITVHSIWTCYRQSQNVGVKAAKLSEIAFTKSSGYLNEDKQRQEQSGLSRFLELTTKMKFVDNAGKFTIYEENLEFNFGLEIERFKARYDLWKHTSPILFVYGDGVHNEIIQMARSASHGLNRKEIPFSRYRDIRGTEFQELFIFVSKDYWQQLQIGRKGLGQDEWEKLTCLHTLLSRPKDSAQVFVI